MQRDEVGETIRDDLPESHQQHVDEQSSTGLPDEGPGRSKIENLRRIRRQRADQRERLEDGDPDARG